MMKTLLEVLSQTIDIPSFDNDYNLTEETVETQDQENESTL